jgi:hypothetical protein
MGNFSPEEYIETLSEIHKRIFSAETLSKQNNVVMIESTALQIRKILELIAYLSVLVNVEKLNHKEKTEWHAQRINELLAKKTTIYYPYPSCMIVPDNDPNGEPVLIPLGYSGRLSLSDFAETYGKCGEILHAQHPFKKEIDIESYYRWHIKTLNKIKALLERHTIGIRNDSNKYTFLYVAFDFSNSEKSKPTIIREFKAHIYDESALINLLKKCANPS